MENYMTDKHKLFEELKSVVIEGDEDKAREICRQAIEAGIDPVEVIKQGMGKAMEQMGQDYAQGECFIPELLIASDAFYAGLEVIQPHISLEQAGERSKVVIGVVQGDTHDIGKNLVKIMLEAAGFEVHDLGRDVPPEKFIEKAEAVGARIIAMSTLMTTAMDSMQVLVNLLNEKGLRDKYEVLIGGGPVSKAFADKIGADDYGANANEAVKIASRLAGK
jgi:corrinoid protein of di/trimethylamine methyltransferase